MLDIDFDEGAIEFKGHAYIPLDGRVPKYYAVTKHLASYTKKLDASIKEEIAVASADIDGERESCRGKDSMMGNLVCDAMLAYAGPKQGAEICIQNGDGLRASIDQGPTSIEEVLTVLPFGNVHAVAQIPGSGVLAALENGFHAVGNDEITGRYPQVGGMTVTVDYSAPPGKRVKTVMVGTAKLDAKKMYKMVTNSFVAGGGDGYDWSAATSVELFGRGLDVLTTEYLAKNNPYTPFEERRIVNVASTAAT